MDGAVARGSVIPDGVGVGTDMQAWAIAVGTRPAGTLVTDSAQRQQCTAPSTAVGSVATHFMAAVGSMVVADSTVDAAEICSWGGGGKPAATKLPAFVFQPRELPPAASTYTASRISC